MRRTVVPIRGPARRNWRQASRVGLGTWIGMLLGIAGKLTLVFTMVGIFLTAYVL